MKELRDIILAYDKAVLQNKKTALATVVQVEGSSYRRPGARMLITETGEVTGAISGGCLEGDALRKAQQAIQQQQNKLVVYDTLNEEDHQLGIQLGCNGIVYILLEPVNDADENNPVRLLKKAATDRKDVVLATVFNPQKNAAQTGTCLAAHGEADLPAVDKNIKTEVLAALAQKKSAIRAYPDYTVLYQFVPPAVQLLLVGAGNDAQPLTEMAFLLGWNVIVADGRPAYATQQRFPKAGKVCLTKPAALLSAVNIDEQTAVVIMTHNYNYDLAALEQLLPGDCRYIGVLGPKKKLEKMLDELKERGLRVDGDVLHRIYGPVGLDLGAETSEEIALSVVAEIKAVFSGRRGAPLKDRPAEIHERSLIARHD
ncbi:MAG: XdhC family protein [Lewinellaceae bacterium]|nr:XdhC family protein [Lewinellaceae bacterium]